MRKAIFLLLIGMMNARAGLSRLDAISMIESGNNDLAVGSAGEVSRYQIKPNVWYSFTSLDAYHKWEVSAVVAGRYLAYLEQAFVKQAGRAPDDFDVYVLWNAGLNYYKRIGFSRERVSPVVRERAERYVNLRQMPGGRDLARTRPPTFAAE